MNLPEPINKQLKTIKNSIVDIVHPKSILLLGSAARNELSFWQDRPEQFELFSDFEFLIVTTNKLTADIKKTLQNKVSTLEEEFANPNPLFHIDFIIRAESRLATLPPIIFTYEMKQNGQLLYGEDIRPKIPDVSLKNLDLSNTNEILYKRLWAVLLHLPKRFILGNLSTAEKRVTGYILCRNALDISTVLLPHEKILHSTYRQRVEKLNQVYPQLAFAKSLGPNLPQFLTDCLAHRLDLNFEDINLTTYYNQTINYLQQALEYLCADNATNSQLSATSLKKVFNEWPISRGEWYNLARLSLKQLANTGPINTSKWLLRPKKGWLTIGLLAMHHALIAWQLKNITEATQQLNKTQEALNYMALVNTPPPSLTLPFVERWLILRQQWGQVWQAYIRLGDSKYQQRFKLITDWTHD